MFLQGLPKQPMPGAVPQQNAMAPSGQTDLQIPFRPAFDQLKLISGGKGYKGDEMILGHGVVAGEIPLVLHLGNGEALLRRGLLGQSFLQLLAAAGDNGPACADSQGSAGPADIVMTLFHVSSCGVVFLQFSSQQGFDAHLELPGQLGQKRDIGGAQTALPL